MKWVKSHSEIKGNDTADMLAKDGANQRCEKEIKLEYPKAFLKEILWKNTKKEWSEEWKSGKHTKFKMEDTKYWLPNLRLDLAKKLEKTERTEVSKIIGLITGHCAIGKHLERAKLLDEERNPRICRLCNKEVEDKGMESIKHWIENCNSTIPARFKSFGTMSSAKIREKWTISKMKNFCNSQGIDIIFRKDKCEVEEETDEED